jgi:hypothetical protein
MPAWLHSEWRLLHAYVPTAFIPPSLLPVGAGQSGQPLHVVLIFVLGPDHCRPVSYEV